LHSGQYTAACSCTIAITIAERVSVPVRDKFVIDCLIFRTHQTPPFCAACLVTPRNLTMPDDGYLVPNNTVAGKWRLGRKVGSGAFGDVYEAQKIGASGDQRVAIKLQHKRHKEEEWKVLKDVQGCHGCAHFSRPPNDCCLLQAPEDLSFGMGRGLSRHRYGNARRESRDAVRGEQSTHQCANGDTKCACIHLVLTHFPHRSRGLQSNASTCWRHCTRRCRLCVSHDT
jgi:hypothetical protein